MESHNTSSHGMNRNSYQYSCILIGILVGVFIQFSSLCSNTYYFYTLLLTSQKNNSSQNENESVKSLDIDHSAPSIWSYPMIWSIFTSSIGVILLLTIRALLLGVLNLIHHSSNDNSNNNNTIKCTSKTNDSDNMLISMQRNMEHSVATGTLWGVSIAWVITDAILGISIPISQSKYATTTMNYNILSSYSNNSYWYIPTLISCVVLFSWHIIVRFVTTIDSIDDNCDDEQNIMFVNQTRITNTCNDCDMYEPLLLTNNDNSVEYDHENDVKVSLSLHDTNIPHVTSQQHRMVRFCSFIVGIMIGILVQCSTLGGTYIGQFIYFGRSIILPSSVQQGMTEDISSSSMVLSSPSMIHLLEGMTIGISFIMSCLGLLLLLCIRSILKRIIHQFDNTSNNSDNKHITPTNCNNALQLFILLNIESYFASGIVLGLNVAWMITDYILFLIPQQQNNEANDDQYDSYWFQSIITLLLSTLWCPILLYCTGYYSLYSIIDTKQNNIDHISNDNNNIATDTKSIVDIPSQQENITPNSNNNNNTYVPLVYSDEESGSTSICSSAQVY